MAGSYPDVPGRRMAWDEDGTICFDGGPGLSPANKYTTWVEKVSADRIKMNNEAGDYVDFGTGFSFALIFPELRDIDGIFVGWWSQNSTPTSINWEYSADTTNMVDGNFATLGTVTNGQSLVATRWREATYVTSVIQSSVRGIFGSMQGGGNWGRVGASHIYGEIAAGETPDRILYIDETTGLEWTKPKDYGDVPRGSARDFEMRIKNNSGTLTANTLTVQAEDLTGGSSGWYTFDIGGGYLSSIAIGSIGAGASSALITVRQIIPDSATLSLHAARVETNTTSWT